MKTMRKALLAILLAVLSILVVAACGEETEVEVQKVPTPENLRIRDGNFPWEKNLLWNNVNDAIGYLVEIDGEVIDIDGLFYDVSELEPLVEHVLRVKAKADPKGPLVDSEWAEIKYTPEEPPTATLRYRLDGKAYTVFKGGELSGRVVIPSKCDGYPVTKIGTGAFVNCSEVTEVVLPDTIVSIGAKAFSGCEKLEKINIPETVTTINEYVFENCKSLASVTLPDDKIELIPEGLFRGCESLESFIVPNSVLKIDADAFVDCVKLNELKLPDHRVFLDGGIVNNTAIWNNQPQGPVYLGNILLGVKTGEWGQLEPIELTDVSPETTMIASKAFKKHIGLTKIVVPDSVTFIGESAFEDCKGLLEVTLSRNLESIEAKTFAFTSLKRIAIPGSVKTIKKEAFRGVPLEEIVFSEGLISIEDEAFMECSVMRRLVFPDSLETIGNLAFYTGGIIISGSHATPVTVYFGKSLKSIGDGAFYNYVGLEKVEYVGTKAQWGAIKKGSEWDYDYTSDVFGNVSEVQRTYTVTCADGEIQVGPTA